MKKLQARKAFLIMQDKTFFLEEISANTSSYELKMFRSQHGETQLETYLKKFAKKHTESQVNKIYLVRSTKTQQLAAWFGLKTATLPYSRFLYYPLSE